MTIPLLSSWLIICKSGKYYKYVVSSVFVLLSSGFDTFHAKEKMEMVCRTFAVLTLPCYLILNNKMLHLTGKGMSQRGINHGWHCFWCTIYLLLWGCHNGAVFCKVALQEVTPFYKQLRIGISPQICFHTEYFQGSKLLNGCLDLVVRPDVFQESFNLWHSYTVYHYSKIKAVFIKLVEFNWVNRKQLNIPKTFLEYLEFYIVDYWRRFSPKKLLNKFRPKWLLLINCLLRKE